MTSSGIAPNNILRPKSSKGWQTSTANQELVADFPVDYTRPSFRTISLMVKSECKVKIKQSGFEQESELDLVPEAGLELDERFGQIYSFVIVTAGVEYYWLVSY